MSAVNSDSTAPKTETETKTQAQTQDEAASHDETEALTDLEEAVEAKGNTSAPTWLHRIVVGSSLLIVIASHIMTIAYVKFANVDESYAAAIAKRLLDGKLLYDGAVSQRGPLMYYSFEAIAKVFGWDNILGLRICALLVSLAHVVSVYWAARKLLSANAAMIAAAIVGYALCFGFPPDDGVALNGETLLIPFLVVGAGFGAMGAKAALGSTVRRKWLVFSGIALGSAICIKQTTMLHPLPIAIWLLADARARGGLVRAARDIAVLAAATLSVPLLFIVHAWSDGTLKQLIYYCYTYNISIHTHPFHRELRLVRWLEHAGDLPGLFFALAIAFSACWFIWMPRVRSFFRFHAPDALVHEFAIGEYLSLHFILALAVACAVPQLFPHYFLVPLPFLALVIARGFEPFMDDERLAPLVWRVLASLTFVWTAASFDLIYFREKVDGRVTHDKTPELAAKLIQSITKPTDKIFVWGFSPWLYEYSHRAPAGRFVFTTYVTGFIPWFWDGLPYERDNVVPGAMQALLSDLDREQPELIVDAGSVAIARSMRAYEPSAAWLHAHYCFEARIGAFDIYRRNTSPADCATTYFPYAAPPVDYFGRPVAALPPMTVDFPESRALPPGDFLTPIRFAPKAVCVEPDPLTKWHDVLLPQCDYGFEEVLDLEDPLEGVTP